jgi:dihydroceramide fatty acyl 2-hydroxylase
MKSTLGMPRPEFPAGVQLDQEARIARGRLYPVTVVYSVYAMAVVGLGARRAPLTAALFYVGGVLFWTYLEYFAHRYVLHGVFPDASGAWRHFLHRRFDDLHWRHHRQPWNGSHINGTLHDTLPFVALFAALSFVARLPTWPVFVAGLVQAYIVEEWVHQSVHFYAFRHPYFRWIRRFHLYHHSPRGTERAFGLTSGLWDEVFGSGIPAEDRQRLFREAPASSRPS